VTSFTPRPLYPRGKIDTHCTGGLADPRAVLDDLEKRKFLPLPGLDVYLSVVQPVASRYTDYATPAPNDLSRRYIYSCIFLIMFQNLSILEEQL
jgi:hypothetical protein